MKILKKSAFYAIFLLLHLNMLAADTIFVDLNANGTNNGTSWANAYFSIYDAVIVAEDGDEIWVSNDIYLINSWIEIDKSIHLYGGFEGFETDTSQRDLNFGLSTLKGSGWNRILSLVDFTHEFTAVHQK